MRSSLTLESSIFYLRSSLTLEIPDPSSIFSLGNCFATCSYVSLPNLSFSVDVIPASLIDQHIWNSGISFLLSSIAGSVEDLITTKRKGWINHGIKGPESIAHHMYRMALMALIAGDVPGINRERCIKIAIVHDIAEAIVGDITPADGVPKVEKSRLEQAALNEMCNVLGGGMRGTFVRRGRLKKRKINHQCTSMIMESMTNDVDAIKVEMILQALEYETDEFFLSTAGKFQTEIGKSWAAEINSRRNSRLAKKLN
ncbi:hypothetical protein LXL04_031985 [Taraxacum kok-saghyz]